MHKVMLATVLLAPWAGSVLIALMGKRSRHLPERLALAAISVAVVVAAALWATNLQAHRAVTTSVPWIPQLGSRLALRLDAVSLPFMANVLLVALVAVIYAVGYLRHAPQPHLCYAMILAFVGSMVGAVLADDLILFLLFWEAMLIASSLLLAGWGEGPRVGAVTLKYFIFTHAGSLLILASVAWIIAQTGTSDPSTAALGLEGTPARQLHWLAAMLVVGFAVKLAIAPLHTWLPDAHSIAPMPVTVLLAAAMLSMGGYGLLRYVWQLLGTVVMRDLQLPLLIAAMMSEVYGALMCLTATDIKRIVAYSSVSQMGYFLFGVATLTPQGVSGSVAQIVTHGILKALLFMGVGIIISASRRREVGRLSGMLAILPGPAIAIFVGAIGLAGVPPSCGFHSELLILSGGLRSGYAALGILEFGVPLLTAAYGLWLALRLGVGVPPEGLQLAPVHPAMRWSTYLLALASVGLGLLPGPLYTLASQVALQLTGAAP